MSAISDWADVQALQNDLICDGWFTPNTYSNHFREVIAGPGVYLFLLTDADTYTKGKVAYVGMSTRLRQRLERHEVYAKIQAPGYWAMRWFKPVNKSELREVERAYIGKFDPPWNVIGRPRGMVLA